MSNQKELDMLGCTFEEMNEAINNGFNKDDKVMFAMSILSDAQEEGARGNFERNRQYINRAKYVLSMISKDIRDMKKGIN